MQIAETAWESQSLFPWRWLKLAIRCASLRCRRAPRTFTLVTDAVLISLFDEPPEQKGRPHHHDGEYAALDAFSSGVAGLSVWRRRGEVIEEL